MEKFKKWVFIGDLHGNFEVATKTAYWAITQKIRPIFIGDLTDSFTKTKKAQLFCIHFIKNMLDAGAICLWGNHDLSYINPDAFACSGYTRTKDEYFKGAYASLVRHENFKPFFYIKKHNVLATHAGFDLKVIPDHYPDDIDPIEVLETVFQEENGTALTHTTRYLRPGKHSGGIGIGGLIWKRPSESSGPLNDIVQVAGHTPQDTCNFNDNDHTWYIDTIEYGDRSILLLNENGEFERIGEEQWDLKEQ